METQHWFEAMVAGDGMVLPSVREESARLLPVPQVLAAADDELEDGDDDWEDDDQGEDWDDDDDDWDDDDETWQDDDDDLGDEN